MKPQTALRYAGAFSAIAVILVWLTTSVYQQTLLAGMHAGRATLVVSGALDPLKGKAVSEWSEEDKSSVETAFAVAIKEHGQFVSAMEWVERFALQRGLQQQANSARSARCEAGLTESLFVSLPRTLVRTILSEPRKVGSCPFSDSPTLGG